jgi:hypothetical protein
VSNGRATASCIKRILPQYYPIRLDAMSTNELESDSYDVVVLGTGLAESIAAA